MSNKTKTTTTEQRNKLDPRMDAAIYGSLLPKATELLNQPAINDRMRQGLDAQYNYLNSPLYSALFNSLLGQGGSLLSRGVAGNPYTQQRQSSQYNPLQGLSFQPNYTQQPAQKQAAQVPVLLNGDGMTDEQRRQLAFLWNQDQTARTG